MPSFSAFLCCPNKFFLASHRQGRQGCSRQPHGRRSSDPPSLLLVPSYSQVLEQCTRKQV
ncbi:hypothetical protein EJ110_NYTH13588 [Nymphaea thermarum]|nr:hypothetical protein EJ110_NYTH13588 [Nymphaea thermarum]